eukprot:TRINITY_DN1165_c0_g1_i1.p1 TRINITY_DN1165_c0_g1~~TRINITY_DN1165_c0_g1_i1.p1  ORF type:complete len:436 (-),score=117.40 TRINITY_DN1165_c0_g1_i1:60-1367(-)
MGGRLSKRRGNQANSASPPKASSSNGPSSNQTFDQIGSNSSSSATQSPRTPPPKPTPTIPQSEPYHQPQQTYQEPVQYNPPPPKPAPIQKTSQTPSPMVKSPSQPKPNIPPQKQSSPNPAPIVKSPSNQNRDVSPPQASPRNITPPPAKQSFSPAPKQSAPAPAPVIKKTTSPPVKAVKASNPPVSSKPDPTEDRALRRRSNSASGRTELTKMAPTPVKSSPVASTDDIPKKKVGAANKWESAMQEKAVAEKQGERDKIRGRRDKAMAYMDKQIRTLIDIIKNNGGTMEYGKLFTVTADKMDALSGILSTAKKRGILDYEGGTLLMQGVDDHVIVRVLKETFEDSKAFKSQQFDAEEVKQALNQPKGPEKCYICSKTVYPTERLAPNNKVMHKACFKCKECNSVLRLDAYCLNNGTFFCRSDYERLFRAGGGYGF